MQAHALVVLGIATILSGCTSAPEQGDAPSWSFTSFDGETHSERTEADASVLFFMATWCSSCRSKAPLLAEAYEEHAPRGVRFLSVDFDPSEDPATVRAWQDQYGHPWPHGLDEGREVQRALGVTIQSSVVVLDGEGALVERFGYGEVTRDALRDAIERALS